MNHFEIIGWHLPTLFAASEKALAAVESLTAGVRAYSFEAHFSHLENGLELAAAIPTGRYAAFCWRKIEDTADLCSLDKVRLANARFRFGDVSLTVEDGQSACLPPYDWDGTVSSVSVVRLIQRHLKPLTSDNREPSAETVKILSRLAADCFPSDPPAIHTMSEWLNEGRNHHYMLKVPSCEAIRIVRRICAAFDLKSGTGSFELCGTPADLERFLAARSFRMADFPMTAANLNKYGTPFALQPDSFFVPVPNVSSAELGRAARLRDSMGKKIVFSSVISRYISWKLPNEAFSPRAQGNYLLIAQQKGGDYAIFLGYERYEDKDPPVSKFISFAAPVLERMGAQLKRVSGPR